MKTKPKISPIQERRSSLAGAAVETESRSVRAALSSEEPVRRIFGEEVLRHSRDAIDLSRAAENGLPLLVNHDDGGFPIGRVRGITLDKDGVLRGDLVFSEVTDAARDAWELAREGTLSDVSVRYRINAYERSGTDDDARYTATDWTLLEASVVSVPADASVGIGRQLELEGIQMPEETPAPAAVPSNPLEPISASRAAGMTDGARVERERINAIDTIARSFADNAAIQDLASQARENGNSVDEFRAACLNAMAPVAEPLAAPVQHQNTVQAGPTSGDKLIRGLTEAMEFGANLLTGEERQRAIAENEYAGRSLIENGRAFLEAGGVSCRGMTRTDIASALMTRYIDLGDPANTTGSYLSLLENVMNKSLFLGFQNAPITWNLWCGTGSVADFKELSRPGVSQFTSLAEVTGETDPTGTIVDGNVADKTEKTTLKTFARKYSVSRKALINDDLGGLSDIANKMGIAAGRTVDEQVYTYLASNPAMTEVANLFSIGNGNLDPGGAQAEPSTDAIKEARIAMGRQTDQNGISLGIVPQYVITPLELEEAMLKISTQNTDPERTRRDNVYKTLWSPVATPHLTDANDWYVAGMAGQTIDVIFLNGNQAPMMARDEGWSVLSAHWRVVLDFVPLAVDYRGLVKYENA